MVGEQVSHYRILEKLGEGGMGVVYKAEDTNLGRTVALKFLPPELTRDAKAKQRFIQEARAASTMDHSNICTIFEIDETTDGRIFISMAYYQGKTLKDRIAEGPLPLPEVIDIGMQVAQGLAKAHAQGIVHRDIKPGNVLITSEGQVKIVDFGLAKLAGQLKLTSTGKTMGTASYMSPEQGRGEEVGPRSDIWSLGIVLYEMVTGEVPFKGDYDVAMMYSIMHENPPSMRVLRPDTPPELESIVRRALEKDQAERYQNADELAADLRKLGKQMGYDVSGATDAWRFKARERRTPFIVAAVVLAAAALLIGWRLSMFGTGRSTKLSVLPRQVTSGDVWQDEPVVSPDGGRIAYTSDASGNSDIYVVSVRGGNPVQLTSDPARDYCPAWFPDGTAIAFVSERGGSTRIWKTEQLGGGATVLVERASFPAISPDGTKIAFSTPGPNGDLRIAVAPLSRPADAETLTGDADGLWSHCSPAWSPDGRFICYSAQHDLWVVPSAGGPARRLTTGGLLDAEPVWSSDGRAVYFSSQREGTLALWRVEAAGGRPARLTMGSGYEHHPSVSGDGSRLAYATQTAHTKLFIRNTSSGHETELPGLWDDSMVAMAPDGSRIVYVSTRGESNADLWIQPLENGAPAGMPQRLTEEPGEAAHPAFSPDGAWVAYCRIVGDQRDIYTIRASGGTSTQFTEDPAADIHPAWSPDGSMLAFASERGGGCHIWIAPVEQGKPAGPPRQLSEGDLTALSPAWSRDGRLIGFVGCGNTKCEAWVIPADGGSPARQITSGAGAKRIRWDAYAGSLLVSGTWGTGECSLRRVPIGGGPPAALEPPVLFGRMTAPGYFDVSLDGHILVYSREEIRGNVWVQEARTGTY